MNILVTNDDGYDAPGLLWLARALVPLGDVTVVAPAECHSSKGHAVLTKGSIQVDRRELEEFGPIDVVHSSPADTVRLALKVLLKQSPDVVVAGINPGANMGVDVYYSGTIAAAREACILGIPSIAVSRYVQPHVPLDWPSVSALTSMIIERLLREVRTPQTFWNVNLPSIGAHEQPRELIVVPHSTEPHSIGFAETGSSGNALRAWEYRGDYGSRPASQDADVRRVFDGYATASLLQLDLSSSTRPPTTLLSFSD